MNYKIIADENKDWLPELQDNEKYYFSLFARKKYCEEEIKANDKTQLKRFTSSKEKLVNKIRQLELPLGTWKLKHGDAPQQALALYISLNPRCMKMTTELMGRRCWDLMYTTGLPYSDTYQIGEDQALSRIVIAVPSGYLTPYRISSQSV